MLCLQEGLLQLVAAQTPEFMLFPSKNDCRCISRRPSSMHSRSQPFRKSQSLSLFTGTSLQEPSYQCKPFPVLSCTHFFVYFFLTPSAVASLRHPTPCRGERVWRVSHRHFPPLMRYLYSAACWIATQTGGALPRAR